MNKIILLISMIVNQQTLCLEEHDSKFNDPEYAKAAKDNKKRINIALEENYREAQTIAKENLYKYIKLEYLAKVLITYNYLLTSIDMDEVEYFNRPTNLNIIIEGLNFYFTEAGINRLYELAKKGIINMQENDEGEVESFLNLRICLDPKDGSFHYDF